MKITKLGHCCLVIEEAGLRIMTDPGAWTTQQTEERNIDYIFITHEHQDHLHVESLKEVLRNNPNAKVVTNTGVGKHLEQAGIPFELLEHGETKECGGVHVEGHGDAHANIYEDYGLVQNTGYFFQNRFFYPGDALYDPKKPVEVLALPVCAPWMTISDAIEYAKSLKPKFAFPVHDGMLKIIGPFHGVPQKKLAEVGIDFRPAIEGTVFDF